MRPICFYHKADLDGVCSAAIVKHFVPDCELYGMEYGDEFPWSKVLFDVNGLAPAEAGRIIDPLPKRAVYMVDFSLPPADMKRLSDLSNLVWVDHHQRTIAECKDVLPANTPGLRIVGKAACELVWAYFEPNKCTPERPVEFDFYLPQTLCSCNLPEAVRLLGRYDVWDTDNLKWDFEIMPFQYGARSIPGIYNPESGAWRLLLEDIEGLSPTGPDNIEATISVGDAILRYQAEVNTRACETGAFEHNLYIINPLLESCDERYAEFKKRALYPTSEDAADNLMAEDLNSGRKWDIFVPGGWDLEDGAGGFGHRWDIYEDDCGDGAVSVEVSSCRTVTRYRALCCNTIVFNSNFFDGFYDPEKHDVMCAYAQAFDGRWKVSLYSTKPTIDCGAIAKTFGGGGHHGASGFMCDKLPWEKA